jgi:hypothetical protein
MSHPGRTNRRSTIPANSIAVVIGLGLLLAACSVGSAQRTTGPSSDPGGQHRLGPVSSPTDVASSRQFTEADNGHSVTVAVGSEVTLRLTNTYWMIKPSSDSAVLAIVSGPTASGAAPSACLPGMGCGTVTATFRSLALGQATISASRTTCGEALLCTGSAGAFAATVIVSE